MAGWRFWVLLTLTIWMSMLQATFGIPFVRIFWLGLQTLREGSCLKLLVLVVFGWKLVKAAILQALEVGTSELPEPEYAKATSESDSDEEMEDAQADDLPKDHPAETAVPFGRNSGASSSGETSALMETLEALHQNLAMLASRLDAQEVANAEFRSFMARQATSTDGIHDVPARILRRLGS